VAVGGTPVALGGTVVDVGAPGVDVAVGTTGAVLCVALGWTMTVVLVAIGSRDGVDVARGIELGLGARGVAVRVGSMVGVAVDSSVGVAAGRANSREIMSRKTVKMKPLRNTRTPRINRCFSFIAHSLYVGRVTAGRLGYHQCLPNAEIIRVIEAVGLSQLLLGYPIGSSYAAERLALFNNVDPPPHRRR
jgi:hypothetical protein